MLPKKDKIFTNLHGHEGWDLKAAQKRGDWKGAAALVKKGDEWIRKQVSDSGLRGRGGAGFPTGMKWGFVNQKTDLPIYFVVNADEGEPGTLSLIHI